MFNLCCWQKLVTSLKRHCSSNLQVTPLYTVVLFLINNDNCIHSYNYNFKGMKCKYREKKMHNIILETEATKGFLVSLRLLDFY